MVFTALITLKGWAKAKELFYRVSDDSARFASYNKLKRNGYSDQEEDYLSITYFNIKCVGLHSKLLYFLIFVFGALTIYVNAWWGIGLSILLILRTFQWQRYQSRPWKRIHFPLMILWQGAAGFESGRAEKENREYNPDKALEYFVKALHPEMRPGELPLLAEKELAKYKDPQFENLIREKLVLKKAKVSTSNVNEVIENITKNMSNPSLGLKVMLIIAEVVKSDAGDDEYYEYLRAILCGKAT